MNKKTAILAVIIILGLGIWYFMTKSPVEAPQVEDMRTEESSGAPEAQDRDMIEIQSETGGDFDGITE